MRQSPINITQSKSLPFIKIFWQSWGNENRGIKNLMHRFIVISIISYIYPHLSFRFVKTTISISQPKTNLLWVCSKNLKSLP